MFLINTNNPMLQPNIEHLLDKGALVLFFLIVLWIVYKYLNIRFEAMKQDIEREIKAKRIRGTGNFRLEGDPPRAGTIELDLVWGVSEKE
jgi:hypothetical protein